MGVKREFPFSALSNPVRNEILNLLAKNDEMTVSQLADEIQTVGRPAVSMHLALLRDHSLVQMRREGRCNYYRLDTSLVELAVEFLHSVYGDSLQNLAESTRVSPQTANEFQLSVRARAGRG